MKDPRIDQYIEKAQPFARPVLKHLRTLIHQACPEVEETIKWGMPAFYYKGPICNIASFKAHAVMGFWKFKLINDPKGYLGERFNEGGDAMGNLGRITGIKDLPPDEVIINFVKQAKKLNEEGVKAPKPVKAPKKEIEMPEEFQVELEKYEAALMQYEKFSPSHRREYLEWITDAKTEATRKKRIDTAVEWIREGKGRNWKYEKK